MGELERTQLTSAQARRLCEKIASQAQDLAELLWELRERKGWLALGYATWNECCEVEFKYSKRHANRLIQSAEMNQQVGPVGPARLSERQTRELAKVPEEKRQDVLDWATEKAEGNQLTAKLIRNAAAEVLEAEPDEDEEVDDSELDEPNDDPQTGEVIPPPAKTKGWEELESFVRKWIAKHKHSICVATAMLENLATKLRTEQ